MSSNAIAASVTEFLTQSPDAVVVEDGEVLFDLVSAHYSCSAEREKCLLHLWSDEWNTVRRVLDSEVKNGVLRLTVHRLGQAQPSVMEISRERDRPTPTARKTARIAYQKLLQRVPQRRFPELIPGRMTTAADLERSFGPVYTRGELRRGNSCWALLGVNAQETQPSIDASLTFGLLWLDARRSQSRGLVEGLKPFVPPGTSAMVRERMALLNHQASTFELYELDERESAIEPIDCRDRGNIATRLVRCREIGFRLCGLEFARAQVVQAPGFRNVKEIAFEVGPIEQHCRTITLPSSLDLFTRCEKPGGRALGEATCCGECSRSDGWSRLL